MRKAPKMPKKARKLADLPARRPKVPHPETARQTARWSRILSHFEKNKKKFKVFWKSPIRYRWAGQKPGRIRAISGQKGGIMGMFKVFDMPKKEPGEGLNTADWLYIIKLIVISNFVMACLILSGVHLLLERNIHRMNKSAKALKEWAKKADFANEMLNDMFRVQQIKESYKSQGIGADEAIGINNKQEVNE